MPLSSGWAPRLALVLAAASWGAGTVISKRAVAEIPPLALLAIQLAASLAALLVVGAFRRPRAPAGPVPAVLGRLGILNPGLGYALSLVGLVSISASLSVLLWAMEPIVILLLAAWLLGERIGGRLLALSAAAIGGLILIVLEPSLTGGAIVGVGLTLAGVVCCAVYAVVARRWIAAAGSTMSVVTIQQAYALAFSVIVAGLAWATGSLVWPATVSLVAWASAAASGVLYYAVAYWLYLTGLRRVPASSAAVAFYLVPVFGVVGGFAALGEHLAPIQWIGAVVVVAAVYAIMSKAPEQTMAEGARVSATAGSTPG
jgi:drug/metabolite transporter (DMT)-like permease